MKTVLPPEDQEIVKAKAKHAANETGEQVTGMAKSTKNSALMTVKGKETKNGMPLIDSEEYLRLYQTDIRQLGEKNAVTFDFQGYVKEDREGYDKGTFYRDAMATNGLLKEEGHEGIHVGTDGIVDYSFLERNHKMKGPHEVGEYDIYITVPPELQKKLGVYCSGDSCRSLSEFDGSEDELKRIFNNGGWIVIRLMLEPHEDPLARQKAQIIHWAIIEYIEKGEPLHRIEKFVSKLEADLIDLDEMHLRKQFPRLNEQEGN